MRITRNAELAEGQLSNPVIFHQKHTLKQNYGAHMRIPYGRKMKQLEWGMDPEDPKFTPYWSNIRTGTPLKVDLSRPRWHYRYIVINANSDHYVCGLDNKDTALNGGSFILLDRRSPYRFHGQHPGHRFLAVALDSHYQMNPDSVLGVLNKFLERSEDLL